MSNLQNATRRDFLRTTGLATAGIALAACAAPAAPRQPLLLTIPPQRRLKSPLPSL